MNVFPSFFLFSIWKNIHRINFLNQAFKNGLRTFKNKFFLLSMQGQNWKKKKKKSIDRLKVKFWSLRKGKEVMTVSYASNVATSTSLSFLKVVFRWRGSVWKNCAREYIIWIAAYFIVFIIFRHEHVSHEWQRWPSFNNVLRYKLNPFTEFLPIWFIILILSSLISPSFCYLDSLWHLS